MEIEGGGLDAHTKKGVCKTAEAGQTHGLAVRGLSHTCDNPVRP
jgi:hypothetical protein